MDFNILDEFSSGYIYNPYTAKKINGEWISGVISIDFLNSNFGQYSTATEMKNATTSEGLKLFFDYLMSEDKFPTNG